LTFSAQVDEVRLSLGNASPPLSLTHTDLSLQILPDPTTPASSFPSESNTYSLTYIEDMPTSVSCISRGGYPPPVMTLIVGSRDVTELFTLKYNSTLIGQHGLRLIEYVTTSWTERMIVTSDDDGSDVTCLVTVPGLAPTTLRSRVVVHCKRAATQFLIMFIFLDTSTNINRAYYMTNININNHCHDWCSWPRLTTLVQSSTHHLILS